MSTEEITVKEFTWEEIQRFSKLSALIPKKMSIQNIVNFVGYLKENITNEILSNKLTILLERIYPNSSLYDVISQQVTIFDELTNEQITTAVKILLDFNAYKCYGEKHNVDMSTVVKCVKHMYWYNVVILTNDNAHTANNNHTTTMPNIDTLDTTAIVPNEMEYDDGCIDEDHFTDDDVNSDKAIDDDCIDEDHFTDDDVKSDKAVDDDVNPDTKSNSELRNDTNIYSMYSQEEHSKQVEFIVKYIIRLCVLLKKEMANKKNTQKQKSLMTKVGLTALTPLVAVGGCLLGVVGGAIAGTIGISTMYVRDIYKKPNVDTNTSKI
jgi:hypothetical protein